MVPKLSLTFVSTWANSRNTFARYPFATAAFFSGKSPIDEALNLGLTPRVGAINKTDFLPVAFRSSRNVTGPEGAVFFVGYVPPHYRSMWPQAYSLSLSPWN